MITPTTPVESDRQKKIPISVYLTRTLKTRIQDYTKNAQDNISQNKVVLTALSRFFLLEDEKKNGGELYIHYPDGSKVRYRFFEP